MKLTSLITILTLASLGVGAEQTDKVAGKQAASIWEYKGPVFSVAFARNGQWLVTGGISSTYGGNVWEVSTGKHLRGLQGSEFVASLSVSPDGKQVAAAGFTGLRDNKLMPSAAVWDLETGKQVFSLKDYRVTDGSEEAAHGIRPCISWSPDGKLLATDSTVMSDEKKMGAVRLWNARNGKPDRLLKGLPDPFGYIAFSPDGKTLAAATFRADRQAAVLWDVASRKQLSLLESGRTSTLIGSIAFSPDSKKLAWAASNEFVGISQLFVWDIATARFEDLTNEKRWSAAIFGSEAKSLIAMDENGRNYYVWNLERRAVTSRVEFKRAWPGVQALALSPDGKILAIGGANSIGWHMRASRIRELGDIRLFDLASGKERLPPE